MAFNAMTFSCRFGPSVSSSAFRAYLAEFISTFFFTIAVVGTSMAIRKLSPEAPPDSSTLAALGVATALAMSAAVYVSAGVSGGHVNPAVTFGMVVGGHITIPYALFYWVAQLLASAMACLLLKIATVDQQVPGYEIALQMTGFGASMVEGVLTFALVYTVYAAGDPRRPGSLTIIGPVVIGFMAGALVMAARPFTGGSINPACSFGTAVVGGSFKNQAVYWIGPLLGAAVAALIYDTVVFPPVEELRRVSDTCGGV